MSYLHFQGSSIQNMASSESTEMFDEDYGWQPPSDAEMKIIQARRERSDKISKLMGDYLLKGYKMLGSTCHVCSKEFKSRMISLVKKLSHSLTSQMKIRTILLQDKQGTNYCIACNELDTDTDKDDPVLNRTAARSQMLEGSGADPDDTEALSYMLPPQAATSASSPRHQEPETSVADTTTTTTVLKPTTVPSVSVSTDFNPTVEVLKGKIRWATEEIKQANSLDYSIALCQVIKNAADAIQSLKNAS